MVARLPERVALMIGMDTLLLHLLQEGLTEDIRREAEVPLDAILVPHLLVGATELEPRRAHQLVVRPTDIHRRAHRPADGWMTVDLHLMEGRNRVERIMAVEDHPTMPGDLDHPEGTMAAGLTHAEEAPCLLQHAVTSSMGLELHLYMAGMY
mmetsp:Transcript_63426/g.117969  ORF Transcript_63426/g.117969 Transcript_63426/m.117969 type:complete len:152 (+) Transcript_63426:481-936(+)